MNKKSKINRIWKRAGSLLLSLVILGAAGLTVFVIYSSEPTATREGATRKSAMLVSTTPVSVGTSVPLLTVLGTVVPSQEIMLSPRVEGEIIELDSAFSPGSRVDEGTTLLTIDPTDYEIALLEAKSRLHEAQADLALEQGRQKVARQDFEVMGSEVADMNMDLVLRGPQLEIAKARVESAEAAVRRAEVDLERTVLQAPFDALVLERNVHVGSSVSPGSMVSRLVGTDAYWVQATVPVGSLPLLSVPNHSSEASAEALISFSSASTSKARRPGRVYRLTGDLEAGTRLAKLLIEVNDPLAETWEGKSVSPLILGMYVNVELKLNPLEGVVELDRDWLRKNNTVWVMKDGKLDIRSVSVAYQNEDYAYITSGLEEGEEVVTSSLATVNQGAELRIETETPSPASPSS